MLVHELLGDWVAGPQVSRDRGNLPLFDGHSVGLTKQRDLVIEVIQRFSPSVPQDVTAASMSRFKGMATVIFPRESGRG
jgi:hypothetical protein